MSHQIEKIGIGNLHYAVPPYLFGRHETEINGLNGLRCTLIIESQTIHKNTVTSQQMQQTETDGIRSNTLEQ